MRAVTVVEAGETRRCRLPWSLTRRVGATPRLSDKFSSLSYQTEHESAQKSSPTTRVQYNSPNNYFQISCHYTVSFVKMEGTDTFSKTAATTAKSYRTNHHHTCPPGLDLVSALAARLCC